MKRIALALLSLFLSVQAQAQTKFTMPPPAGVSLIGLQVVSSCGAAAGLVAGNTAFAAMDTTGNLCTNATGGGGGGGGGNVTQGTTPWVVDTVSSGGNLIDAIKSPVPSQSPTVPIGGVSICDGANGATNPCTTPATVKPASTPAAATDKALVVALRPGEAPPTLPSGAATAALQGTDPCVSNAKTTLPITLATAAVKVIAVGVSAKKIYVCQLNLNNNAVDTVAIFEATTATVCVTSPVAVVGAGTSVATAGAGYNFAATGGISLGNGGAQVLQTATNANDLCIAQSATTQLTGSITYVTQ